MSIGRISDNSDQLIGAFLDGWQPRPASVRISKCVGDYTGVLALRLGKMSQRHTYRYHMISVASRSSLGTYLQCSNKHCQSKSKVGNGSNGRHAQERRACLKKSGGRHTLHLVHQARGGSTVVSSKLRQSWAPYHCSWYSSASLQLPAYLRVCHTSPTFCKHLMSVTGGCS